jgi:mannose-6-phosphate isomerase-like protein (cupin superfamily)
MRSSLVVCLLVCFFQDASAQKINVADLQGLDSSANIQVKALFGDSLVSSFYIEIQKDVPAHFHRSHSEHVYVLTGQGCMRMADSSFAISSGDLIFIPKGTPHSVRTTSTDPLRVISIQAPRFLGTDRVPVD